MAAENTAAAPLAAFVNVSKDFVSLLRDGSLLLLAVLLVAFPARFNAMLVAAGFEEGSVVGFKWKSRLIESNSALEQAQQTITSLQAKNDELVKALDEANAKARDPALLARAATLTRENSALKAVTDNTKAKVAETIESNIPLVEKALTASAARDDAPTRSRGDYSIGLQTLGIPDGERQALNQGLRAEGYALDPITWSYPAGQRPAWFSDRSTVFYYANASRTVAEQVAQYMESKTGQTFAVRRGSGLGVDPAKKEVTFFVHYLKGR